jgi:RNA polymerase sigma factor (sigma-70 family)
MIHSHQCTGEYLDNILHKYGDMVLRICMVYMKSKTDAEDIYQDVFLKLFKKLPKFESDAHERAWIVRVTINSCKDQLKSSWFRKRADLTDLMVYQNEEEREIVSLVLQLPLKYRRVIHLHYYEDYSTAEIAAILKIREGTVRTQLHRARLMLKDKLSRGELDA